MSHVLDQRFWDIVPEEYETLNSLNSFKESKKKKKKKKKKNGYHLTIPVDFVKPMYMVLVL